MKLYPEILSKWRNTYSFPKTYFTQDRFVSKLKDFYMCCFHRLMLEPYEVPQCEVEYNEMNLTACIRCVNSKGRITKGPNGYAELRMAYGHDEKGDLCSVTMTFFDQKGNPCRDKFHCAQIVYTLDACLQVTSIDYRDSDGIYRATRNTSCVYIRWFKEGQILHVYEIDWTGICESPFIVSFDSDHRFVESWHMLNSRGELAQDDDGGYGSFIERDPKTHLPFRLWNLNVRHSRRPSPDGVSYWEYKIEDNLLTIFFYDEQGHIHTNVDGVFGFQDSYSDCGYVIQSVNLDAEGNPCPNRDGIQRYLFEYDEMGRIVSLRVEDAEGKLPAGMVNLECRYGKKRNNVLWMESSYLDAQGKLTLSPACKYGEYAEFTEFGYKKSFELKENGMVNRKAYEEERQQEGRTSLFATVQKGKETVSATQMSIFRYQDNSVVNSRVEGGQYVSVSSDIPEAVSRMVSYDEWGREYITLLLDRDSGICPMEKDETYTIRFNRYFADENYEVISYFDENQLPVVCSSGYHAKQCFFDDQNRMVKEMFLDKLQNPCMDVIGSYGVSLEYDENDPDYSFVSCLDAEGNVLPTRKGYSFIHREVDDQNRVVRELWFDKDRKPFTDEQGNCGIMRVYMDNVEETISLDENGDPHNDLTGVAVLRTEKDDKNRVLRIQGFNMDGDPVSNYDGIADFQTYYDDKLLLSVETFYDAQGHLRGRNSDDVARIETYYDAEHRIVKMLYLNAQMDYQPNQSGNCGVIIEYKKDKNGRDYEFSCDLNELGQPLCVDGVYWYKRYRDEQGRLEKRLFYDNNRKPCKRQGVSGEAMIYEAGNSSQSRLSRIVFLNRKGEMMEDDFGVANILYAYDHSGASIKIFFNIDGLFVKKSEDED